LRSLSQGTASSPTTFRGYVELQGIIWERVWRMLRRGELPPKVGRAPVLISLKGYATQQGCTSYKITADIEAPQGGAEGVINTNGGRFGGYSFFLLKGKPVFVWRR